MKQLHFNLFHCCLVLFVAECARGLFIPSLWSTVQYVRHAHIELHDDKHDRAFLGYCIGIFSAGRMAGSLAMGAWSDKRKDDGLPILVCVLISLTSACTYLLGCYFRSYWVILTAMCGLGFGGGSLAVCRSHVSRITVESSRLLHMTLTTVAQYVGLAVMPMVALGVNHLVGNTSYRDDHGINETPSTPHHTWWNHHTAPAWLLVLLNLFSCITHFTIFIASYESQEHIDARKAEEEAEARLAHHRHEAALNGVVHHDVHADDPNVHTAPTPTTKIIMDENAIDDALATQPPTVTTVVVNVDQQEHHEHQQLLNGRSDSSSGLTQKNPSQTESTDTHPIIRSSSATSSPSSTSRSLWQRMHEGALYVGMCLCILPKHHRYNALSYTEDLYDREGEVTARNKARLLRIGCVLFIFMNFTVRGVLAVIETVGTPQLAVIRHLHTAFQEIEASSLFFGLLGLAGLLVFVVVVYLPDHIHEAVTLTVGFAIVIIGSAVIVWGGNKPAAFYFGCVCIWSLGYPAIQNSVFSAFSRILGSKPQGSMMGLIQVFGSLGRITLPLVSSQSSVTFAFAVCVVLCVVSVVGLLFYINLGRIEQERLAREKRAKDGIIEKKEIQHMKNERKCVRWGGNTEKEKQDDK